MRVLRLLLALLAGGAVGHVANMGLIVASAVLTARFYPQFGPWVFRHGGTRLLYVTLVAETPFIFALSGLAAGSVAAALVVPWRRLLAGTLAGPLVWAAHVALLLFAWPDYFASFRGPGMPAQIGGRLATLYALGLLAAAAGGLSGAAVVQGIARRVTGEQHGTP